MGVAQALELGNALDALPENIILYGIEIDAVTYDSTLSKPVEKAIHQLVIALKKELRLP
jgi:hydrogenase maturation protease